VFDGFVRATLNKDNSLTGRFVGADADSIGGKNGIRVVRFSGFIMLYVPSCLCPASCE
jgi:hypothetical protein